MSKKQEQKETTVNDTDAAITATNFEFETTMFMETKKGDSSSSANNKQWYKRDLINRDSGEIIVRHLTIKENGKETFSIEIPLSQPEE
jgi:hypothetical protein